MAEEAVADRNCNSAGCGENAGGGAPDRKIGLLLVHGMGEQSRGEHAEKVVRSLVASWGKTYDIRQTTVRSSPAPEPGDDVVPDVCPDSAPITVRVVVDGDERETVDVHFHEVWWADLGQRPGFLSWLRFLWWVVCTPFSLCKRNRRKYAESKWWGRGKRAGLARLASPRSGLLFAGQFFVLLFFAVLALMSVFTWGALRRLLQSFAPSPVVLLQYFGDVQVYREGPRVDTGSGLDMAIPPRFSIRRRMITEMVAMAEREYDRWYVMAHSLGSVVAFNGLVEPDYILPNYLQEKHWRRLDARFKTTWKDPDTNEMWPRRPTWLEPEHALSRQQLFGRLGGFVTYGCPLHLFVDLWRHVVPINRRMLATLGK